MKKPKKGFGDLKADVISQGLCCSCGTCVGICPKGALAMSYGDATHHDAEPEPVLATDTCNDCSLCYHACPGKEIPLPELDRFLFGRERDPKSEPLGIYKNIYEGYATNLAIRKNGATGGSMTALAACALEQGMADGVIVAANDPEHPWRMKPTIATSAEELMRGMSTKHCLVPTNALLQEAVFERGLKRIGIVGCPCHIEAVRKIQRASRPRKIADSIAFTLSVYCATNFWWEATRHLFAEECGIGDFREIKEFTYRGGERPQHFISGLAEGTERKSPLFSTFLNYLFPFQSERCSACYDWSGELADLSFGDLYIAFFLRPPHELGWNSMLVRTPTGERLLSAAMKAGYLFARKSREEYTVAAFGCECKKHGSAHNLTWRKKHGWVIPDFGYDPGVPDPWPYNCRNAHLRVEPNYFDGV